MAVGKTQKLKFFRDLVDWECKSYIDKTTDRIHFRYIHKRKTAPHVTVETPIARKLAGYTLIERDLRTVKTWLEMADSLNKREIDESTTGTQLLTGDEDNDLIVKALFVAAFVFYGKCFAQAKGRKVKLEKEQLPIELQTTHDEIIQLRNNYAAHSGEIPFEFCVINLVFYPRKKHKSKSPFLLRESIQTQSLHSHPDDVHGFIHLVEHLLCLVRDKLESLNAKVFEKEIHGKGLEFWRKQAR